jgi:uncharacterized protein YecE (DUF72 family)
MKLLRSLFSAVLLGVASSAALAVDPAPDIAAARAAADAADEQLVEARRALWLRLPAEQKPAFARLERAWINEVRVDEERQCRAASQTAEPLAAQNCRLLVAQQHLNRLSKPATIAQAGTSR